MNFKVNEETLKRRLKFYMPALFLVTGILSVATFSILLRTVYQLSSSLVSYLYLFIFVLVVVFCVSIYFDCVKLEKGKSFAIGKVFVVKAGIAVVLVAIFSYSVHIYHGRISVFEMLNIRLIMVIFLISIAMSISSMFFNLLVGPLYKKTGKVEYYLPIAYNFLPISMATVIFIVTLVNGLHYRSEIVYDREYDINVKKGYANDLVNNISDSISKYVKLSQNVSEYVTFISSRNYNFNDYLNTLSKYLNIMYADNDYNVVSLQLFFNDVENFNINTNGINKLLLNWRYDINNDITVNTNANPSVSGDNIYKLATETNSIINMDINSDAF